MSGRNGCVVPFSEEYLVPIKGNIRCALEQIGAQPYESVYVCFDEAELQEAILTRLGTVLVGQDPLRIMPDIVAEDSDDAVTALKAVAGESPGASPLRSLAPLDRFSANDIHSF